MKLIAQVQLFPSDEQRPLILAAMRLFNVCANYAAQVALESGAWNKATVHRAAYAKLRTELGVSAYLADGAVTAVATALSRDRTILPTFRPDGAARLSVGAFGLLKDGTLSLRVAGPRMRMPFMAGERQRAMLPHRTKHASLVHRDGKFFLHIACTVAESAPVDAQSFIGVDLGVTVLATTSDGQAFTGEEIEAVRIRHAERRRRLNREATRQRKRGHRPKNVRRALKRLGKREALFRRDVNHCITKKVVQLAEGTKRGIAVENLNGIRARIRFRKDQRAKMGAWAFAQWQGFCAYKALRAGVPFVVVNAAYTSQTCAKCGHCDKASRLDQARFVCTACGYTANADHNAAQNIAARGAAEHRQVAERSQKIAA